MTTQADHTLVAQIAMLIEDRLTVAVPAPGADLIDSGLLDSLALVMLIALLEEHFACELPLDDFDLDNFRSVEQIAAFVASSGVAAHRDVGT